MFLGIAVIWSWERLRVRESETPTITGPSIASDDILTHPFSVVMVRFRVPAMTILVVSFHIILSLSRMVYF